MATIRSNGQKSVFGYPLPASNSSYQGVIVHAVVALTANPSINDLLAFLTIPKGHTIVHGVVQGNDIDTGTEAFDFDLGTYTQDRDGNLTAVDDDALGNFGIVTGDAVTGIKPEAGIYLPFGGTLYNGPIDLTENTVIAAKINAAAATFAAGNISIHVTYVKTDTAEVITV